MKKTGLALAFSGLGLFIMAALLISCGESKKEAAVTKPVLTVYMQMGGMQGDPSTLARTNGAKAAAQALNIKLVDQYSGWDPNTMINQFKEAVAASPDAIIIMGHPGEGAFESLVDEAITKGIIITSGNNPLPRLEAKYQDKGFGYAGAELFAGGYLTGQVMIKAGLKSGDKALIYDIWHEEGRRKSPEGMEAALKEAGVKVDRLDVTQEVNTDISKAIPILTGYLEKNKDCMAIGTQHGNITSNFMKILQQAGKKPGEIITGGIDLSPQTLAGIEQGYVQASFDQVLYLQGYFPVLQVWLSKMYKIPGLHINTGVGAVTPQNLKDIKPLIEKGIR